MGFWKTLKETFKEGKEEGKAEKEEYQKEMAGKIGKAIGNATGNPAKVIRTGAKNIARNTGKVLKKALDADKKKGKGLNDKNILLRKDKPTGAIAKEIEDWEKRHPQYIG